MNLGSLEGQKGTLRLLVLLLKKGEINVQKITSESDLYYNIVNRSLRILSDLELITQRIDNSSYPPKNMISLTEKGKIVAEHLKKIEEVLEK